MFHVFGTWDSSCQICADEENNAIMSLNIEREHRLNDCSG